jgi:hypothetical protein
MKLLRLICALPLLLLLSCQREVSPAPVVKGKVRLQFSNMAGGTPFQLNTPYINRAGEDLVVTKYKYYISNIVFIDTAGRPHPIDNSYFLVDHSNTASLNFEVAPNVGRYHQLQFLVGVDSIRNVSGAQTGALDPLLDMFWTWNTGYIMAKLEGTSSLSTLPNNRIEYHIGGFKGVDNALRTVTLPFTQASDISNEKTLVIGVQAELFDWFDATHALSLSTSPAIMSPGPQARKFADNYATMFSITSIQSL